MSEPQYAVCWTENVENPEVLGPMAAYSWRHEPRSLLFRMARYKFVSKMLAGKSLVAEVGCADGWLSRIVAHAVGSLDLYDFDPEMAKAARGRVHDMLDGPLPDEVYDAIFALDVFEHIAPASAGRFLANITASLADDGVAIIGIPSLESQKYASAISLAGHVNCMTGDRFKAKLAEHFSNVFVFSQSDEVVHTGFYPMASYLLGLCIR